MKIETNETAVIEAAPEAQPAKPAAKPKGKGKKKSAGAPEVATLELAAQGYLGWMEANAKSPGTIASYTMELKMAISELGADTKVADLTSERVAEYFNCKRVTLLKNGRPKAKPSVDKSRRVCRLMLVWAKENGWITVAPIPESL